MEHVNAETNRTQNAERRNKYSNIIFPRLHRAHTLCSRGMPVYGHRRDGRHRKRVTGAERLFRRAICYHPEFSLAQASLEGSTVPYNPSSVKSQSFSRIILFPHNMLLKKWPIAMHTWALFLLFTGKTSRCSYRVNILHFKNVLKHHCSYNSREVLLCNCPLVMFPFFLLYVWWGGWNDIDVGGN